MPCPDCNPAEGRDDPPKLPPGFIDYRGEQAS